MLDNCEHLIGAVAELVAFLVSTTAELRVLTTSRAPLAIACRARLPARAARDRRRGAAVLRARARGAADRRSDDGGRGEHRHAGSMACRWRSSWPPPRFVRCRWRRSTGAWRTGSRCCAAAIAARPTATRRCWPSSTGRGTCSTTASSGRCGGWRCSTTDSRSRRPAQCSGDDAVDAVQGLVDQSLLSVRETPAGLRYRMLETVREFGRMQLVDCRRGRRRARRPATMGGRATRACTARGCPTAEQFAAIDALSAEEINLADELRGAIATATSPRSSSCSPRSGCSGRCGGSTVACIVPQRGRRRRDARLVSAAGVARTWPGRR